MPKSEVTDSANATAIEKSRKAERQKAEQQKAEQQKAEQQKAGLQKAEGREDHPKSTAAGIVGWLRTSFRASKRARALPASAGAATALISAPVLAQAPASATRVRGCLDILEENEPSPSFGFDREKEAVFNQTMADIFNPPETSPRFEKSREKDSILKAFKEKAFKFDDLKSDKTLFDLRDMSLLVQHVEKCWKDSHNPFGLDRELAKELEARLKSAGFEQLSEASQKWSGQGIVDVVKAAWWDETERLRDGSQQGERDFDIWFSRGLGNELNRVAGGIIELKKAIIDVITDRENGLPSSSLCLLEPPGFPPAPATREPAHSAAQTRVGSTNRPQSAAPVFARSGKGRTSKLHRKDPQRRLTQPVQPSLVPPSAFTPSVPSAMPSAMPSAATVLPPGGGLEPRMRTPEPL